jgi:glycosyltransferase involved in cell wall biosynthesis
MEFGAPEDRIKVIPNGVNLSRYDPIRSRRKKKRLEDPGRIAVGFLGRVVAIKDVKTLIRAARKVVGKLPKAQFFIVGPTDEEPMYFQECEQIVAAAGLQQAIKFTGPATLEQALPEFDIMVLSSISEGLPFAVLEAFAAEIAVISTDVGSCPELIEGRANESPGLGIGGRVVPVGDAEALAEAIRALAIDRTIQDKMGWVGRRRVEAYYQEELVIREYREIYERLSKPEHEREQAAAVST